jgi:hypothetical protein
MSGQAETVGRQALEIEMLKGDKKRMEHDLNGGIEVNDPLEKDIKQPKEEIKTMKPKQKAPVTELVELNGFIKLFAPSMKKDRLRSADGRETDASHDIPDGIIAHLKRNAAATRTTATSFSRDPVLRESD